VKDVCNDIKKIDDPIEYGYDFRRPVIIPESPENATPTWINNVRLFQTHLVSDRFIEIIDQVLKRYPNNRVQTISFSAQGYPLKNGKPVFAVYHRKKRTVIFNLLRHFENAEKISLKGDPGFSIRSLLWHSMLHSLLHEIHHSIALDPKKENDVTEQHIEEKAADRWCEKELEKMAREMDIEPPPMEEETFFRVCFNDLMIRELENGNQMWVDTQQELLNANLMYHDQKSDATIETMAAFYGVPPKENKIGVHNHHVHKELRRAEKRLNRFMEQELRKGENEISESKGNQIKKSGNQRSERQKSENKKKFSDGKTIKDSTQKVPDIVITNKKPIHPKYINIIELASFLCPTSLIYRFIFSDTNNYPSLCRLNYHKKEATIFTEAFFQEAFNYVKKTENLSFRASLWFNYLCKVLECFLQACETEKKPIRANLDGVPSVIPDNLLLGKLAAYAGQHYDVEPPRLSEDSLFGKRILRVIEEGVKNGASWALYQQKLIHFICFFPIDSDLAPFFIRDYFCCLTGNQHNDNWPKFVPSFNADDDEIEKTKKDNYEWQQLKAKRTREKEKFQREMELWDKINDQIEKM
jgi:hypothetical protein